MEAIENILSRKSIRKFDKKQITSIQLDTILDCAKAAPSAKNEQAWYFVAIQKEEIIENLKAFNEKDNPFYGAPTVILCFAADTGIKPDLDTVMAMENMMLAANALELGSCFVTWIKDVVNDPSLEKIKTSLGVPNGYHCLGSVVVGYPLEQPEGKPRKHDVISVIR